jgi:hypothetical protein
MISYTTLWAGPHDGLSMALPPHDPATRPDLPITQAINGKTVTIGVYRWCEHGDRYVWAPEVGKSTGAPS